MMAPSFSWFASGFLKGQYDPGAVLVTSQPKQQQWKVDSVFAHSERSETNKDFPTPFSMASLRMICSHLQNPDSKVFARVYVQVPLEKTEFDSPEQRKKQAVKFEPMELLALHKLNKDPETSGFTPTLIGFHLGTQPETGLVPGGFHTLVVWQIVPGVQLGTGNMTEDQVFWSLPDDERARIRERFQSTLGKMLKLQIIPDAGWIRNLVWDKDNDMLYWVGFREWHTRKRGPWSQKWYVKFGLAEAKDVNWSKPGWNGDVSNWRF